MFEGPLLLAALTAFLAFQNDVAVASRTLFLTATLLFCFSCVIYFVFFSLNGTREQITQFHQAAEFLFWFYNAFGLALFGLALFIQLAVSLNGTNVALGVFLFFFFSILFYLRIRTRQRGKK